MTTNARGREFSFNAVVPSVPDVEFSNENPINVHRITRKPETSVARWKCRSESAGRPSVGDDAPRSFTCEPQYGQSLTRSPRLTFQIILAFPRRTRKSSLCTCCSPPMWPSRRPGPRTRPRSSRPTPAAAVVADTRACSVCASENEKQLKRIVFSLKIYPKKRHVLSHVYLKHRLQRA